MHYHHLGFKERLFIERSLEKGHSFSFIARNLLVHRSTIQREVERNGLPNGTYRANIAQYRAEIRRWKHDHKGPRPLLRWSSSLHARLNVFRYKIPEALEAAILSSPLNVQENYFVVKNRTSRAIREFSRIIPFPQPAAAHFLLGKPMADRELEWPICG